MKQNYNFKFKIIFACLVVFSICLFNINKASAQTITENISLSFGKIVLVDNSTAKTVELLPSGSYLADPDYIFFSEPRLGNITVDGYPPLTPLIVSIGTTTLDSTGGGLASFTTSDTFTNPAILITDLSGSITFDVGAKLTSDGSGAIFTDNDYEGVYTINVSP